MTDIGIKKTTVWYAASQGIYGEITRDLHAAWTKRLGQEAKIVPEEKIQQLFNDIRLFPSKSQIFEMVHCAREGTMVKDRVDIRLQCDDCDLEDSEPFFGEAEPMESDFSISGEGRQLRDIQEGGAFKKNAEIEEINTDHIHNYYLTLGEFCVFATELRRRYDQFESNEQEMTRGDYLVCHKKDCSGRRSHTYKRCKHHHYHHPYRHNGTTVGSKEIEKAGHGADGNSSSSGNSSTCSINQNIKKSAIRAQKSTLSISAYDVFLGGSCNPTTWRQDSAIPFLKSHKITYYNPQQSNWVPEMMEWEHQAKQSSRVLLFVVAKETRNIASMIEISYLAGNSLVTGRRLVTYLETYPGPGHHIADEPISGQGMY